MTWLNQSACLEEDPDLFFPIGVTGPALVQIEEAKVVCRRCEVVEPCLKWAIEFRQDAGVWGGLSGDERHDLNSAKPTPVAPRELRPRRNSAGPRVTTGMCHVGADEASLPHRIR